MREIALLLLVLVVIKAHAEGDSPTPKAASHAPRAAVKKKERLDLTPPGQANAENEDPGSATRLLYADPRNPNSPAALNGEGKGTNLKPTCSDNMGMIYKKGDQGFDGCMRSFGSGTPPALKGDARKQSVGISIGQ